MTIHDAIRHGQSTLERAGLDEADAAFDAEFLARHALGGWERGQLVVHHRSPSPPGFVDRYHALLARREKREPAAYIVGVREFWELDLVVAPGVLIPRPETELVVEEVLNRSPIPGPRSLFVADVGTGSGCLSVALARWLPHVQIVATDMSERALSIARLNVDRHGVADRVTLIHTDLLPVPDPRSPVPPAFDVIVSNPPYVPTADITSLQPEVRDYEPREALDGGPDGLDVIRRLVPASARVLAPAGMLVFEFGFGQESGVRRIVEAEPDLQLLTIRADYAGIPRVAVAVRTNRT
jgi:release factor glutamine methyltransferase